jgi:hypothetical protein
MRSRLTIQGRAMAIRLRSEAATEQADGWLATAIWTLKYYNSTEISMAPVE